MHTGQTAASSQNKMSQTSCKSNFFIISIFAVSGFFPIVLGVYEIPEIKYLPPYFGCFHTSLYSDIQSKSELEGSHFYFNQNGKGVLPADCIAFCLRNPLLAFEIAAIKGDYCVCAHISNGTDSDFNMQKVDNVHCDLTCPSPRRLENPIYPNKFCGGNIPYSIYCAVVPNRTLNTNAPAPGKIPFCDNLWISSVQTTDLYKDDWLNLAEVSSGVTVVTECALCINYPDVCQYDDGYDYYPGPYETSTLIIGFQYSPKNSPLKCVNYCRRLKLKLQKPKNNQIDIAVEDFNFVAILGSRSSKMSPLNGSTGTESVASFDTCFCIESTEIIINGFNNVAKENCARECPGDSTFTCGGIRNGSGNKENSESKYFVLYGIFNYDDDEPPPICEPEESTTTASATDETIPPTTVTIENSNPNSKITTNIPIPVSLKTTKESSSTMPTSNSAGNETTTNKAPTTKHNSNCTIQCFGRGSYYDVWRACAGEHAEQECLGKSNGTVKWYCQFNGKFRGGKPDYKMCKAHWVDEIEKEIIKESDLNFRKAEEYLKKIEAKCINASIWDGEYFNESFYYGHEISKVMDLGGEVMLKLREDKISMYENLTSVITSIVGKVLDYQYGWSQLSAQEKSQTGKNLIKVIENSLFVVTSKAVGIGIRENYKFQPDSTSELKSQVSTECGVVLKSRGETVTFPRDFGKRQSYIQLPKEWVNLRSGSNLNSDEVEFVGVQLNVANAIKLFSPESNMTEICEIESEEYENENCFPHKTIINSDLMSLSLGNRNNLSKVKFLGSGVSITFEHTVMAWGSSRPVRRKLHEAEIPKAIRESAACVFLDTVTGIWSSKGCRLVESGQSRTVCECDHLTAFALLMDIHNYESKEFGLELLTWILSPISALSLAACIIVFIKVKDIQGPRTTITKNLCVCLLIGIILVNTVMDRNYIYLSHGLCMTAAMLVHYIFLCAFSWMALEGLLLYRMIILVFDTQRHYMKFQRIGAYGIPLLIVGITWLIGFINDENAYGGDEFCWLEENYKWGFMGPVGIISMLNLMILITTIRKAYEIQSSPKAQVRLKRRKSILSWIRGSFGITVLLGGTWVFGFMMAIENETVSRISAYVFIILNASQGIFLFLFNCILNKKVRDALKFNTHFPAWISISTFFTRSNSNSSRSKFGKKTNTLSFSDNSTWSRQRISENIVEQIGRRELSPDF